MPKQTFLLKLPVTKRSEALLRMVAKASVAFSLRRDINMLGLIRGAQISYASVRATVIIKQKEISFVGVRAPARALSLSSYRIECVTDCRQYCIPIRL